MVVSDFGLARRLEHDQSSFAPTANNLGGTSGWRAPECILGIVRLNEGFERLSNSSSSSSSDSIVDLADSERDPSKDHARLTKAVDLFALGCLYFWTIMGGQHPFGHTFNQDSNIVKGDPVNMKDMADMHREDGAQVEDIIRKLVSLEPATRSVFCFTIYAKELIRQTKNVRMSDTPIFLAARETAQILV
jgi:serine/threonine-protein kinase/endoribonuclease IRE1